MKKTFKHCEMQGKLRTEGKTQRECVCLRENWKISYINDDL